MDHEPHVSDYAPEEQIKDSILHALEEYADQLNDYYEPRPNDPDHLQMMSTVALITDILIGNWDIQITRANPEDTQ